MTGMGRIRRVAVSAGQKGVWLAGILLIVLALTSCDRETAPVAPTPTPGECVPTPVVATPTSMPTASVPTATPIATPPVSPTPAAEPGEEMLALQRRMSDVVTGYSIAGRYAVAVTDLQTGETVGVNEDRQQLSACVMNFFVLALSVQDVERGAPMERVSALIDSTIYSSNAYTASRLFNVAGDGDTVIGVQRVAGLIAELGLDSTVIDHPPGYPEFSLGVSRDNLITASDANGALAALYGGRIVGEPLRSDLLERMTNVKAGLNYLTAYGTGGVVSHKNGFFPIGDGTWVDNDIGIVRFWRGDQEYAYAISFFSDYVEAKYGDIALGQELSRMAWAYFDARYPAH